MLTKCPECELQVSDKAITCPHCGYPLQPEAIAQRKKRASHKRKRLPNGFGQISEIKDRNLRKPFRAMVTVGKTEEGRPICKPLKPDSYFATYNEAYAALVEYHKNPYSLEPSVTLEGLYEKWLPTYEKKVKTLAPMKRAWKACSPLYKMKVSEIRIGHIKTCMENGAENTESDSERAKATAKQNIKSLFNMMLDYAVEYGVVDHNYAREFSIDSETNKHAHSVQKGHASFTDEEMEKLWANVNALNCVDVMLIQCYSGWRPQELGLIELADVDLESGFMKGGMKTEAGTDRLVPIHPRIKPLVERKYKEATAFGSKYLINYIADSGYRQKDYNLTYSRYKNAFNKACKALNINTEHTPHDCRKQFVTMAKAASVDEFAIKYMVGHVIADLTERVYTDRSPEWLKSEIEKIK